MSTSGKAIGFSVGCVMEDQTGLEEGSGHSQVAGESVIHENGVQNLTVRTLQDCDIFEHFHGDGRRRARLLKERRK